VADPPPASQDHPSKFASVRESLAKRELKSGLPLLIALIVVASLLTKSISPSIGDLGKAAALFLLSGLVGVLAVAVAHMYLVADHFDKQQKGQDALLSACLGAIQGEVYDLKTDVGKLTEALPDHILAPPPMSNPAIAELANAGVLLTDQRVAEFEGRENERWEEIWIVTADLHKDLPRANSSDLSFNDVVLANLGADVRYIYFVPDDQGLQRYFQADIAEKAGSSARLEVVWLPPAVWRQTPFTIGDSALYKRGTEERAVLEVPQTKRRFWIKVDDVALVRKLRRSLELCAEQVGRSLD
jgi:hypothetical protein